MGSPGELHPLTLGCILGFYTVAFLEMGSSEMLTVLPDRRREGRSTEPPILDCFPWCLL